MKIHLKVTSAVLAVLLTASLLGLFTLPALGNDYHAGTFGITVTNAGHLHSMKLTLDMDTIVLYDQTQHLTLLTNLFTAKTKTEVQRAENALSNYLEPIAAWLAAADADAGTAFNSMCSQILSEARTYYNANNSLSGYTPSYGVAYRPSWERAAATDADLANDERTYFEQSGSSPLETFDASYVKATTFDALSDLTKTTCLRAKLTIRIINSAGTSNFYAYSSEVRVGPQEYHAATAATCTEDGLEEYYICSTCGRKVSFYTNGALNQHTANGVASVHLMVMDDESLIVEEAPGHRWDEGVITTPATCSSEGETLYTCTVCGETNTQTVPMIPHTVAPDAGWIYEAEGAYRYHVCTVCGAETDKEEPTALTFPYTQTCGQYKLHGTTVELDHNYPRFDVDEYIALHFDYKEETDPALKAEKLALRNAYKAFFVNWFAANGWESTINNVISYIEADATTRALAEQNTAVTYNYNVQFRLNNGTYKQLYALEGSADQPDYTYANTVPAIDFSIRPQNGEYDFDLIDKFVVGLHVTTRYGATSSSVYVARLDMSFTTINKYPQAVAVCGATGYAQDVWYCAACGGYYSYYQADGTPYTVLCEDGVT
ncbi:MAG: hypothetical protein J6330_11450, partial [Clostridia bacterium]|nr:hypothetical protein [Clostridia bacterium]